MIRPHRFAALAVALVASAPLAAQQPAFTLEQALSAPFPDNLVAAATGGAVAWVFNANGARNIWVAAPPEYQGRPVTAYADDDGQEIGDLVWTPDGKAIAFTRRADAKRLLCGVRTRRPSPSSGHHPSRAASPAPRGAKLSRGRSASRRSRPAPAARSGRPIPARAARSTTSSPTSSCCGSRATASCSRGKRTDGRTCTPYRSWAAGPRC